MRCAGFRTMSGAYSGWFQGGPVLITGNGNNMVAGDPGCGAGYAGIGVHGNLSNCKNYTLLADTTGDTYLNSTGGTGIHFRNNNNGGNSFGDLATIDNSGNLTVAGKVHSGNAVASVVASNRTVASTGDCVLPLSAPDSNCLTPNTTLTVTTSGGPVLIMANIGGVEPAIAPGGVSACAYPNFYLVMDSQIIATQNLGIDGSDFYGLTVTMISLQTPAAGKHTFQVQEADDASQCGSGDYSPTLISLNLDAPSWPCQSSTNLVSRSFSYHKRTGWPCPKWNYLCGRLRLGVCRKSLRSPLRPNARLLAVRSSKEMK